MQERFPEITVRGTHFEVGTAIGSKMGGIIRKEVEKRKRVIPSYNSYLDQSRQYYEFTRQVFPQFIEEIDGISKGAGVDTLDYFFINNREVYDGPYESTESMDHCTIAVSFSSKGAVVGHNEDWDKSAMDELYVLRASIGDTTFVTLNYAVGVSGISAGINNAGLVQCINDLYSSQDFGVPKNFLARAILEAKTLDQALNIIANTKRASGFNHVLVLGSEGLNVEIAGNKFAAEAFRAHYVHTNHFVLPQMVDVESFHTQSSIERYKRAKEIVKSNMTAGDMGRLLSDTQNREFPINRDETIASIVFEPAHGKILIARGDAPGNFVEYSMG